MNKPASIHFVGIKGVGMTPLAIIAKEAGIRITGSDLGDEFITDPALQKAGITPFIGFDEKQVEGVDLVITTGAHGGFENVEVKYANFKKIPVLTQGQAVGEFMKGELFGRPNQKGISVAGTHGKTTTTAMIATVLSTSRLDPSYLIGTGSVMSLSLPGHFGIGDYFVAEADEYATEPNHDKTPKLLWQFPHIAVLTNIEFDHPDVYASSEAVKEVFLKFASQISENGLLVVNGDDVLLRKLLIEYKGRAVTYGKDSKNDYKLSDIQVENGRTHFKLKGKDYDKSVTLNVIGEHNAMNAAATIIVSLECGIAIETVQDGLFAFKGSKRRSEFIGETKNGIFVFDDYAHHPTELKNTLKAFRHSFPQKQLICVFQPHTYSRTKKFFDDFSDSFSDANIVIIIDIYPSAREPYDASITSEMLVKKMNGKHPCVLHLKSAKDVVKYIQNLRPEADFTLVTMGAGDIYKIGETLVNE